MSGELLQPVELILPRTTKVPSSAHQHGTIFISGGYLCYTSGAAIVMIGAGSEPIASGAAILL